MADSSVWIDYFNNTPNPARHTLRKLLHDADARLVMPDLVLFEVLRGFRNERELRQAQTLLMSLPIETVCSTPLALEAAQHDRDLRKSGITMRSSIDVLVAAFCIKSDYILLHRDRNFDHFAAQRGLRVWPL